MKKQLLLIFAFMLSTTIFAQVGGINYKALITDNGSPLNAQTVTVKFTILRNTVVIYEETETETTDANGILVTSIGDGVVLSGNYSTIDWAAGVHFLKVEIDSGSGFVDFGTSELKYVPYAKFADKAGNVFSGSFNDLTNVPADIADGDDDTQLTDAQITAMGYIKDANDADHSTTNELQTLAFDNASRTLSITNGNSVTIPAGGSTGGDGWGTQTAATDASINGDGTSGSPLGVNTNDTVFSTWDKNAADDFDGDFSSLSNVPSGLADGDDDTQLTDAQITAMGYIKDANDADHDAGNELQTISKNASNVVTLSNGGGNFTDDVLTESDVDTYVSNNGFAKSINDLTDGKIVGYSLFLGNSAGLNEGGNNKNIGIGISALKFNTSGFQNVALGFEALKSNTTGNNNVANGYFALRSNTTGRDNVAVGASSLNHNTTGNNNTANGFYSLLLNTEGDNNVANGYFALRSNTTGNSNVAVGKSSLSSNTTGEKNIGVGASSLYNNTIGNNNVSNGFYSLYSNTEGNNNVSNGYFALRSNTTGNNNVANGSNTLYNNTIGNGNVANGFYALYDNISGSYNASYGFYSLKSITTGIKNTAIGYKSGFTNEVGVANVFIGSEAGYYEIGSNKLYIENSNSSTPLIGGDFSTDEVTINGTLQVTGGAPGAGKIFTSDANGKGSWQVPAEQSDADFYVVGTTDTSHSITDDIYHNGTVVLGMDDATVGEFAKLKIFNGENEAVYIEADDALGGATGIYTKANGIDATGLENNIFGSGAGMKSGIINMISTSDTGDQYGNYNILKGTTSGRQFATYDTIYNSGNAKHYGRYSVLSGSGSGMHIGSMNKLTGSGTGLQNGVLNRIENTNDALQIGVTNLMEGDGNGNHAGVYNDIDGAGSGDKYGTYSVISASAGGKHYAVYGEAEKVGVDVYAGYFKGDVKTTENIEVEGKVTASNSGDADLKPYIYGFISEGATGPRITTNKSTSGFTVADDGVGQYKITFANSISNANYIVTVAKYSSVGFITYTANTSSYFTVNTYNTSGVLEDSQFTFVVYKK